MRNNNLKDLEDQILEKWKALKEILPDIGSDSVLQIMNTINRNEAFVMENSEEWKNNRINWVIPWVIQDNFIGSSLLKEELVNKELEDSLTKISENKVKYQTLSDEYYKLAAEYNKIMIGLLYNEEIEAD